MKKICTLFLLPVFFFLFSYKKAPAQCQAGYSQVTLNWDYLDYLVYSGTYDNGYLTSAAQANTQYFAFGTNRLTIATASGFSLSGDNTSHTGHSNSYATDGADVQFTTTSTGTANLTLSFEQNVMDLKFSLYDLDNNQRVTITASNGTSAVAVNLSKANSSSGILFQNNPGNSPQARGIAGSYNSSDNKGTVNVDIDGPVKTVTLAFSNSINEFWLSDITACSPGNFPTNYYDAARPLTGQPGYVLHAFDNDVYALNPATGVSKFVFSDNAVPGNGYINSLAYDAINRILYYVYTQTDPGPPRGVGGSKVLRKYDFNTETASTVLSDLTSIGIPVSTVVGVESGGATFYNGSLYIGIEPSDEDSRSGREAVIWRIDFNASNTPIRASQVFALPIDNGSGRLLHDWADFVIFDGVLYDFDQASNGESDIYQFNLLTGNAVNFANPSFTPGQPAIDWDGNIYQLYANDGNDIEPYVALYNPSNGSIGTKRDITAAGINSIPNLGDAAEGFRPKSDFGDAPASYTPNPQAPATHERDANLRLGSTYDFEWNQTASALANADGADEDGIGAAPALNIDGTITYTVNNIRVYNNTGSNATLVGWLDYNFNGTFEVNEAALIVVPSSANMQLVTLNWNNIRVQETSALRTFLRLRVASTSSGMNASTMNGWFPNGEVEDFPVLIGTVLPKDLLSFSVAKNSDATVGVKWSVDLEKPIRNFEILRSTDNTNWASIGATTTTGSQGIEQFAFNDEHPLNGIAYYRLRIDYQDGGNKFSEPASVKITGASVAIKVLPNPVTDRATIQFTAAGDGQATVLLLDKFGKKLLDLKQTVTSGTNNIVLNNLRALSAGVYTVRIIMNNTIHAAPLVISR